MRKTLLGLMAVLAAVLVVPTAAGASNRNGYGSSREAQVYVVHGLPLPDSATGPGTPVDVYVNGDRLLDDFTFGRTVGPVSLPAGDYDVQIRTPDGSTTLIQRTVAVPATGSFSLVASYVDAAGTPGINVFANDTSRPWRGFGAIALHHAAAAPAVDVDLGLFPYTRKLPWLKLQVVSGAANGAQARFVLPSAAAYTADVRVAGTRQVVLPLDDVRVKRNTLTNVYVVGSAAAGTLQALVSSVPVSR
ncbi:MAG: DUF4397 domain-containing protein [Microthrixaceae bacterium]|nr:DUF4397 domain-containing protein [Microthrixaceae bacterium]MCB9375677.1 DUF4397 domain-containing protein [Microthrixaceae bacterium]MCB9402277.1 DUF4397 domain-containing protein [Microthrixaceae bacterium]MCO5306593.1 DUF4397 domain-containing protein [Microthrixaceae bacterium]